MTLHPLSNFEIQKYYPSEPRFNHVYSRDNLQKIKDDAYIINCDDIGTLILNLGYWNSLGCFVYTK